MIKYLLTLLLFSLTLVEITNGKPTCNRHQSPFSYQKIILSQEPASRVSIWILNFVTVLTALSFLILLGIVKGLFGILCCAPLGMWGLGTLIDLPQPLEHYQERSLRDKPVVYDHVGWPVHPDTGKRSVRALPKKTEFFLNTIFFITYPLAMMVTVCSWCCFQDTNQEDQNFKYINTITIDYSQPKKKNAEKMMNARTTIQGKMKDTKSAQIYEGDSEEDDTKYVLYQMKRSQESLKRGVVG